MAKRATIADVARLAGVSTALVSYALNDRPGISEAARRRVLEAAAECGWRPSAAARALAGSAPATVGLVPVLAAGARPDGDLLRGLHEACAAGGFGVLLAAVPDPAAGAEVLAAWWAERRIAGALLLDPRTSDPRLDRAAAVGLPVVLAGFGGEGPGQEVAGRLHRDEGAAFALVAEHLAPIGHRRFAHVTGPLQVRLHAARAAGLGRAVAAAGGTVLTVETDLGPAAVAAATARLLRAPDRPTALVLEDDVGAVVALDVARRCGLDVPWELSVVAGEDSALCRTTAPSLTALDRDARAWGVSAGRAVLDAFVAPAAPAGVDGDPAGSPGPPGLAAAVLAVRGSTAPAPHGLTGAAATGAG